MNDLDLLPVSDMDQMSLTEEERNDLHAIILRMDEIVKEGIAKKDVEHILKVLDNIVKISHFSGLALARGIYGIYKNWQFFGIDDNFIDYIYVRLGKARHTIERYVMLWDVFEKKLVPEEYVPLLQAKKLQDQIPVAYALNQGYELSDSDWQHIVHAPTAADMRETIRKIKKTPARSSNLHISINREGDMFERHGNSGPTYVGYLIVDSEDEFIRKAVNRIINNAGITQV